MLTKLTRVYFGAIILLLGIISPALAKLENYTYPYDISQIEWQVLNWTAAWKGTTTPADPFILDRIEYDRKTVKVSVYLKGKSEDNTEDNLKKSLDGITKAFTGRLAQFDPETDLIIHYTITSPDDPNKTYQVEYRNGSFGSPEEIESASTTDEHKLLISGN